MNAKAPVTVVMPEVKLTLADLAYMTGLLPGGTRCHGGSKITDKLVFLGLVEKATIKPCAKAVAAYEQKLKDAKAKVRAAIKERRWSDVHDASNCLSAYNIRNNMPKEFEDFILTASGRQFMAEGHAQTVTSSKAGCVKG